MKFAKIFENEKGRQVLVFKSLKEENIKIMFLFYIDEFTDEAETLEESYSSVEYRNTVFDNLNIEKVNRIILDLYPDFDPL